MYDPTVFENVKVAFENHVYDLDNIERKINIINRTDRMDFSIIKRDFSIEFVLSDKPAVSAEIIIEASLEELAAEILEIPGKNPGCTLQLKFQKDVMDVPSECKNIELALKQIWEGDITITQHVSFEYGYLEQNYVNTTLLRFRQKINEDNITEIEDFLASVIESLELLHHI
ncbi:hypothetical protein [Psychrobacillus sp. MER TA 171]|uniref:hypothetical protein n=1 Tax=Psychrobacillus sp. MER TA 171 TaxID=2939577 RepID=UPI00203E7117|nr:hypothetical protein [Psychrobacillus sp. MER TA 171]MCM3360106.1 hypothetical protein [Psychrobacillus sp. MER TA 171]